MSTSSIIETEDIQLLFMPKPWKFMQDRKREKTESLSFLSKFQIVVGVVISAGTFFIGWKAQQITERSEETTLQLKVIEQQLAESKFGFERIRDIYDRTEKYLEAKEQSEARGKVLVVLINSMPNGDLRSELLNVVTEQAKLNSIAARAAAFNLSKYRNSDLVAGRDIELQVGAKKGTISGAVSVNEEKYSATVLSELQFTDSTGYQWVVPKGTVISSVNVIARIAWAIAGPPLSSDYTLATILLEYHAAQKTKSAKEIQKMFAEALQASGVSKVRQEQLKLAILTSGYDWH